MRRLQRWRVSAGASVVADDVQCEPDVLPRPYEVMRKIINSGTHAVSGDPCGAREGGRVTSLHSMSNAGGDIEGALVQLPVRGVFGFGAFKDEPWSLQAYQKRKYAVTEFYKVVLKGTCLENPGEDEKVAAMLKSLVTVVGKKRYHVPEVHASWGSKQGTLIDGLGLS